MVFVKVLNDVSAHFLNRIRCRPAIVAFMFTAQSMRSTSDLIEGDIKQSHLDDRGSNNVWTNGVVPYEIDSRLGK